MLAFLTVFFSSRVTPNSNVFGASFGKSRAEENGLDPVIFRLSGSTRGEAPGSDVTLGSHGATQAACLGSQSTHDNLRS